MKPYELEVGDSFKVIAACVPTEMEHFYKIIKLETRSMELGNKKAIVGITMDVQIDGQGEIIPLGIGPWVEVIKL